MSDASRREGFIPVTGGRVRYRAAGADRRGVPILALHGGPGAPHDYLKPLEVLADERPVYFYDQLGCGLSDNPKDASLWTIERYAEELGQVREALGLERVHLLGHSWGTMVAAHYMLARKPEGVSSLVLSAPCLSASRWYADQRAYLARMPEEVRGVILSKEASGDFASPEYQEAVMGYYRRHVCRLDPWPDWLVEAFGRLNQEIYRHMWGPSEFTVTGTLKEFEVADRMADVRVPVLFTVGRFDEASPEAAEHYRSRVSGAELAVFEDASHLHLVEKPGEYAAAVRAFLRRAG